ncbi:MAG: NAD(P)/FAD-dependent oxidoreductase [Methanomassiliicoccales archaeon]|nr:NAD(P)/FAD-dependent oxidoreductase [Methanomassiliicoccales archaeon]
MAKRMETDVAIIGSGPAGIQAAIHASRKKVRVVVIGHSENSALVKAKVENYFSVTSAEGKDMLEAGREQALRFGAQFFDEDVVKLKKDRDGFHIITDHDREVVSKTMILAPGISRTKLGINGEKEYLGKGVSYCAACDCHFFKKKRVVVVGDESVAASASLLLREYASKVYWIARRMKVAQPLLDKVRATDIEIRAPASPIRILGDEMVTGIEFEDGSTLEVDGVFIELGAMGSIELALEIGIIPDPKGFIPVDAECRTEASGVFACGDVTGTPWQLAKAVGQGCIAGTSAARMVRKEE